MIASGLRIGRYEVGDRLGKGSFGVVHLARDVELGRDVALKVLKPEYLGKPSVVQRFLKEARAAATIGHPGIVTVFECGQITNTGTRADGNAYIAMELLRGESLTDRMEHGRLPVETVIAIGRQLASALEAAHTAGIIHRDLKPDNVFLIPDSAVHGGERVKLLDFGMAKLADLDGQPQTHSKMILGTPRYMSPEQARSSAKIDHRSDIYALGCILYELSCGHAPFTGDAGEVIVQHQSAPPPRPSSLVTVPAPLDQLIVRMLAKQPDERPQSMAAVERELAIASAQDLEPATIVYPKKPGEDDTTTTVSEVATTVQERWRLRWRSPRVLALAIGGLVLGGAVTFILLASSRPARLAKLPEPAPVAVPDAAVAVEQAPRTVTANEANQVRAECQGLHDVGQWQALLDCAHRLAPLDDNAATAFEAAAHNGLGLSTTMKRTECKQLVFDKKWQDAIDCASQLQDPEALKLRVEADAEGRAEATLRRLQESADKGELRQAKQELEKIAPGSVYRKDAEKRYRDAETSAIKTLVSRATSAKARDKTCRDYQAVLEDAVVQGVDGAVKTAVRCTPVGGKVAAAPPPPPAPPPTCDPARSRADGEAMLQQGLDAAALMHFETAIKCGATGDVFVKAFMAACRSRNEPKARQYYTRLPSDRRDSITQICIRNGITF